MEIPYARIGDSIGTSTAFCEFLTIRRHFVQSLTVCFIELPTITRAL